MKKPGNLFSVLAHFFPLVRCDKKGEAAGFSWGKLIRYRTSTSNVMMVANVSLLPTLCLFRLALTWAFIKINGSCQSNYASSTGICSLLLGTFCMLHREVTRDVCCVILQLPACINVF